MRELERRLAALEMESDPRHCFECAMRGLNATLGDGLLSEPCLHPRKPLHQQIVELDTALAGGAA